MRGKELKNRSIILLLLDRHIFWSIFFLSVSGLHIDQIICNQQIGLWGELSVTEPHEEFQERKNKIERAVNDDSNNCQ
jgi:hypothetical protein